MTLTITDTTMTSDQSAHTARHAPDRNGWEVSWFPGQIVDRNTAITAMTLADTTAEPDLDEGNRLWPHIQGWAAELGQPVGGPGRRSYAVIGLIHRHAVSLGSWASCQWAVRAGSAGLNAGSC